MFWSSSDNSRTVGSVKTFSSSAQVFSVTSLVIHLMLVGLRRGIRLRISVHGGTPC